MSIEFMRVLQMSVMTPEKLEEIRDACYRWAILNCRLKANDFYRRTPVNHFRREENAGETT